MLNEQNCCCRRRSSQVTFSNDAPLALIAGPCVIESEEHILRMAFAIREIIGPLARAATAVGIAGVFVEVHEQPEKALSDGANALRLNLLGNFWARLKAIDEVVKR